MKRFVFILFIFSLFSCKETKKENISHLVKEWNNKKIVYPDIMHFTVLGADTNFSKVNIGLLLMWTRLVARVVS
jgi:hypothetical protein